MIFRNTTEFPELKSCFSFRFMQVKIRVFKTFPTSAEVTDGGVTADVFPETKDLVFQLNEFGPKILEMTIYPFLGTGLSMDQ